MSKHSPRFATVFCRSLHCEWRRLKRNPQDLAMLSWLPVLLMLLMWWMFSAALPGRMPLGVLDQDHSAASRQLTRMLDAPQGVQVVMPLVSSADAAEQLRSGHLAGVVVIPRDFERGLKRGHGGEVTLLHNAQWSAYSGLVQRDVRAAVGTFSAGIELRTRQKLGQSPSQAEAARAPIASRMTSLFNPAGNYQQFLAATALPALLFILSMASGAWVFGTRLRDADFDRWLQQALPAPASARFSQRLGFALGALLLPWLGLMISAMLALWLMHNAFAPTPAAWGMTCLLLALFVALSLLLGAVLALGTLSLRMALSLCGFISAPAYAFSGAAFPLIAMPTGARLWAESLPLTHYLRQQIQLLGMQAPISLSSKTLLAFIALAMLLVLLLPPLLQRALDKPERWGAR